MDRTPWPEGIGSRILSKVLAMILPGVFFQPRRVIATTPWYFEVKPDALAAFPGHEPFFQESHAHIKSIGDGSDD